jgi:hypothetical protein
MNAAVPGNLKILGPYQTRLALAAVTPPDSLSQLQLEAQTLHSDNITQPQGHPIPALACRVRHPIHQHLPLTPLPRLLFPSCLLRRLQLSIRCHSLTAPEKHLGPGPSCNCCCIPSCRSGSWYGKLLLLLLLQGR